jgi:hypothetical protein
MKWLRWFIAGALAVPLFHQIVLLILNATGWVSRKPFALTPTKPFGIPQVISLSFWGGVWGVLLGLVLVRVTSRASYWLIAIVFGAIAPTLVAIVVVAPLKGQPVHADAKMIAIGMLVNAAWGLGTAAIARVLRQPLWRAAPDGR